MPRKRRTSKSIKSQLRSLSKGAKKKVKLSVKTYVHYTIIALLGGVGVWIGHIVMAQMKWFH